MVTRPLFFLAQLVLIVVVCLGASILTEMQWIVPSTLRKQTPLDTGSLAIICTVFAVSHAVVLVAMWALNAAAPLASLRRYIHELYAALSATSIAALIMFVFFVIPFSANYYAWIYVLVLAAYISGFIIAAAFFERGLIKDFVRVTVSTLSSIYTVLVVAIVILPGAIAVLYKMNRDFSNTINDLRARMNFAIADDWALVPAFSGQTFEQPMGFAFEPGRENSILVLSRTGRLYRYRAAPEWREEVLLDLSDEVGGVDLEMGAYNFVVHPEFNRTGSENAGYVYVYFTHTGADGSHNNRMARFDLSLPDRAAREASRLSLIDLSRRRTGMHNGGGMFFGPDGFLYFSTGDFNDRRALNRLDKSLIGGIFRIDVDQRGGDISAPIKRQPEGGTTQNYHIPKDNPWFGEENALEEYWALGFRNPWRMSMDPDTGDIWVGDVGMDRVEEQNRISRGDNAQWDMFEGPFATGVEYDAPIGNSRGPIYFYEQTALSRAAMGGVLYKGDRYPGLKGLYIFGDNQAGTLHVLDPAAPMESARIIAQGSQFGQLGMTSIHVDRNGEIYVTFLGSKERPSGEIVRLVPKDQADTPAVAANSVDQEVATKYLSVCSRCHGADGKGAPETDMDVARPDFTSAEWQDRVNDEHLRKVIVEGGEAVGLSDQMPPWEDFFSQDELDALVARLRAFRE